MLFSSKNIFLNENSFKNLEKSIENEKNYKIKLNVKFY